MVSASLHFEAEVLWKERKIQKAHDSDPTNDEKWQNSKILKKIKID